MNKVDKMLREVQKAPLGMHTISRKNARKSLLALLLAEMPEKYPIQNIGAGGGSRYTLPAQSNIGFNQALDEVTATLKRILG